MEILKCDRCRCELEKEFFVKIQIIDYDRSKTKEIEDLFFGATLEYQNASWDLCYDCGKLILKFLGHIENELPKKCQKLNQKTSKRKTRF